MTSATTPPQGHRPAGGYSRRFVVNTLYGLGGRLLQVGVSLFLVGYVIRKLGAEQWGLVVIATTVVAFLRLIQLGASAGIAKKLNTYLTQGEVLRFRQYFTAGVVLCVALSVVMAAALLAVLTVFWDHLKIAEELAREGRLVFGAIGLASVCMSLTLPFTACLQAVHRIDINAKLLSVGLLLRCALVVLLFELLEPRASIYAGALILANLVALSGEWVWVWRNVAEARFVFRSLTRPLLRDIVAFNVLTLFNSLNYVLFMQSPAFILQTGPGLATVGLYGIGLQLDHMVRGFLMVGISALSPVVVSLESSGRRRELRQVFCMFTKAYAGVGMMMWLWFCVLGGSFLRLWLDREVAELVHTLPWLMGASAIGIVTMPAAVVVVALERLRVPAASGVILALIMVGIMFHIVGEPQAHLLTALCIPLFCLFAAYQAIRFGVVALAVRMSLGDVVRDVLLRPAIPALGGGIVLEVADRLGWADTVLQLVLITACAGVVFVVLSLLALFSREERTQATELLSRLRRVRTAGSS